MMPAWPVERLPGPYEVFELGDREIRTLRIVGYDRGTMEIVPKPPRPPEPIVIPVLRVHLSPGVKPYPPMYWDVTSKTLIAQLWPMLTEPHFERYSYRITAYGIAPRKRFTVERITL